MTEWQHLDRQTSCKYTPYIKTNKWQVLYTDKLCPSIRDIRLVLVHILDVDFNCDKLKNGEWEWAVFFVFMWLLRKAVLSILICVTSCFYLCLKNPEYVFWQGLETQSQSSLTSIWQGQKDISVWKMWCYICQGATEVDYSTPWCKSGAEVENKVVKALTKVHHHC